MKLGDNINKQGESLRAALESNLDSIRISVDLPSSVSYSSVLKTLEDLHASLTNIAPTVIIVDGLEETAE